MGEDALDADIDGPDVIDAGRHPRSDQQLNDGACRRRVGPKIGKRGDAQCEDASQRVEGKLGAAGQIATMSSGKKFLQTLRAPFDRSLELPGAKSDDGIFGIDACLHAEAAADVADQHSDFLMRDAEHFVAQRVA